MKPEILLDVMWEDLVDILKDKGWNATTVTKQLGASTEERADDNIFKYANKTRLICKRYQLIHHQFPIKKGQRNWI